MTERETNIALREMASEKGLCEKWYGEWGDDSTLDECAERFVRGLDFCIDKDYPPLDFVRRNIPREVLHRHGIFLDEDVCKFLDNGIYVFMGECTGKIYVAPFKAITVYLLHDSDIDIVADGLARVYVSTYHDASCGARGESISIINRKKTK